jgi:hypothetical protein
MLKKLVLGALMIGLLGVLIVGAINRTIAKNSQVTNTQIDQGQGQQQGANQDQQQGNGRGQQSQAVNSIGVVIGADWITYEGAVTQVSVDEMVIEVSDGTQIIAEGKPWEFAQDAGFSALVGDTVTLSGYYEDDEFKVGVISNADNQSVQLRDETGRPSWAGRGRRGN